MDVSQPEWLTSRIASIKNDVVYDENVDNWFLMPSWIPVTSIVVVYLIFVKIIGPRMMENQKPHNIKYIMLVYNLVQTVYNAYIVSYFFIPGVPQYLFQHSCTPLPRQTNSYYWAFTEASYLYFLSKIIDLLDTVFFVLRKKQSHVSFLHVYHHSMMVFTTWACLRYFKSEQSIFIGLLNSVVHVVMYSYYFLAACGPEIQKYLWWKKYLTKFQLIQFVLFCIHQGSLLLFECEMPVALTYYIFFQAGFMCALFANFYYQTFIKKHNKEVKAKE